MARGGDGGAVQGRKRTARTRVLCVMLILAIPVLVQANCSKPDGRENRVLTTSDLLKNEFPEGSNATFECVIGYVKTGGKSSISCTGGTWTDLTLQCEKKDCGSPGDVLNGRFDLSQGTAFGAVVYAICNEGYEVVGQSYRQCFAAGWTERVPVCEVVKCDNPPEIEDGKIVNPPMTEFPQYMDVIQYKCNDGYTLIGQDNILCNASGEYEPEPPRCKVVTCPTPNISGANRVSGGPPPYRYKHFVVYECKKGSRMIGKAKLVCEVHGWSDPLPTCELVTPIDTTTTTTTTATRSPPTHLGIDPKDEGTSTNYVKYTGIGVGCVVLFVILVGLIAYFCKRQDKGVYYTREEDQKSAGSLL